jgi:hypothetical protein
MLEKFRGMLPTTSTNCQQINASNADNQLLLAKRCVLASIRFFFSCEKPTNVPIYHTLHLTSKWSGCVGPAGVITSRENSKKPIMRIQLAEFKKWDTFLP